MTNSPETTTTTTVLHQILHHLLPLLLLSALSVTTFITRWRLLHSKLSHLHSSLSSSSSSSSSIDLHPLLLHLLPNLHSTLLSLHSLSSLCSSPSSSPIPSKLLLQSDLDIASISLSSHIHDLDLLLKSGLHHSPHSAAAAIVLSLPTPASSKSDIALFIRDVFVRIQIGSLDLKQKAIDSLLHLITSSDASKISLLVVEEGDVSSLIRLLDPMNHSLIRDRAVAVVAILVTASDVSRKAVFEEGGIGPLLRVLESGSAAMRENAAMAIEAITSDQSNAWAISAYGGVEVLVAACRSGGGSPAVHALAAGSLKNIAVVDDLRAAMAEEGAVSVLIDLIASGNDLAKKNAAFCIWSLASDGDEEIRASIFEEEGLKRLQQLIQESSDPITLEHGLRAIQVLSSYLPAARDLASSHSFFSHLTELIKLGGNVSIQQISASLISSLSPNEEIKRSMAGCISTMIKLLELPKPASAQEAAAMALVCLLSVRSNRIELGRDGNSMMKLVQMLDPKREEICKKFPVSVVMALCASGGCRKRLNELGACQQLQKLADSDVAGAKKAAQKIAGSRLKNLFSLSWRE